MENKDLIAVIEQYFSGMLSDEERTAFEKLRKEDPEVNYLAEEYIHLFKELNHTSGRRNLDALLSQTHSKLEEEGVIQPVKKQSGSSLSVLWSRYKYTMSAAAIAASIVSFVLLAGSSLLSTKEKTATLTPLVNNKLSQMENKLSEMENKLKDVTPDKPSFEPLFRATGFLIDGKGYVITNAHVVKDARNLIVENKEGQQYTAISLYSDRATDLAILKITDTSFAPVRALPFIFKKSNAQLSTKIFTLGYPREEMVYDEGYLSATSGFYNDTSTYQINISVNPGNSGGPVIDKDGEIIGIISSKETNADGVVFAVKSDMVMEAATKVNETRGDTISLPSKNTLKNLSRVKQINNVENFIYKVKGN